MPHLKAIVDFNIVLSNQLIKGVMEMSSTQRTAFILQIHKNPSQVNKFIYQLVAEDQADVYIHIDKRQHATMKDELTQSKNVKVLEQSIICEWGDFSQIDTTILLLREVLASGQLYDFVCLRSGQDLLVKEGFKNFLVENKGKVFMEFFGITWKNKGAMKMNWPKITRRRYTTAHPFRIYRRILKALYDKGINLFPNRNFWPEEYDFYCGSQWFTIPIEVAKYIIDFLDANQWYYEYFKDTYTPDEWFFHTLLMNSPYKSSIVNNNLLYLRMGEKLSERNSPVYLTKEDIPFIESSSRYFARKFDDRMDYSVIDYFTTKVKFGPRENENLLAN